MSAKYDVLARLILMVIIPVWVIGTSVAKSQDLDPKEIELGQQSLAFHGKMSGKIWSFKANTEAIDAVKQIVDAVGLPLNFDIRAAAVPNAQAQVDKNGNRLILYSVIFMQNLVNRTKDDWSGVSIMAHEVGHHLSNHIHSKIDSHKAELQADHFSGFVLGKMGASLNQALLAIRELGTNVASTSHPGKDARLQSIALGWKKSQKGGKLDKLGEGSGKLKSNWYMAEFERTEFWKNNIDEEDLVVDSFDECAQLCADDTSCKAFTFTEDDNLCEKKDDIITVLKTSGKTSGVIYRRNPKTPPKRTNVNGLFVYEMSENCAWEKPVSFKSNGNLDHCITRCNVEAGCNAFTFYENQSLCRTKLTAIKCWADSEARAGWFDGKSIASDRVRKLIE